MYQIRDTHFPRGQRHLSLNVNLSRRINCFLQASPHSTTVAHTITETNCSQNSTRCRFASPRLRRPPAATCATAQTGFPIARLATAGIDYTHSDNTPGAALADIPLSPQGEQELTRVLSQLAILSYMALNVGACRHNNSGTTLHDAVLKRYDGQSFYLKVSSTHVQALGCPTGTDLTVGEMNAEVCNISLDSYPPIPRNEFSLALESALELRDDQGRRLIDVVSNKLSNTQSEVDALQQAQLKARLGNADDSRFSGPLATQSRSLEELSAKLNDLKQRNEVLQSIIHAIATSDPEPFFHPSDEFTYTLKTFSEHRALVDRRKKAEFDTKVADLEHDPSIYVDRQAKLIYTIAATNIDSYKKAQGLCQQLAKTKAPFDWIMPESPKHAVGPADYYVDREGVAAHVKGLDSLCQRIARRSSLSTTLTTFHIHKGFDNAHRAKVFFVTDGSSDGAQVIANLGYDDFQRANTYEHPDGKKVTLGLDETLCNLSWFHKETRRVPSPYTKDLVESEIAVGDAVCVSEVLRAGDQSVYFRNYADREIEKDRIKHQEFLDRLRQRSERLEQCRNGCFASHRNATKDASSLSFEDINRAGSALRQCLAACDQEYRAQD